MVDPEPDGQLPASQAPVPAERQAFPFLVLQFFIFPMAIVAVCVTVFVVFGLIASEGRSAREYLGEVRSGGANRRWQAAFELSKLLLAKKDPALADPRFVAELVALFDEAGGDDPRVRRYLALALGRLGDRRAVPSLLRAVQPQAADPGAGPADAETQIYAIWSLGVIGDASAVPTLAALTRGEDAGIRKAAAHALGAFDTPDAREALVDGLDDPAPDVRWNAALGLGRQGNLAAAPVLLQMMDRERLASVSGLSDEQREQAILGAVGVAAGLPEPSVRSALESLTAGDPSLKVREAARVALAAPPRVSSHR
jgi:HEAT repeat protein